MQAENFRVSAQESRVLPPTRDAGLETRDRYIRLKVQAVDGLSFGVINPRASIGESETQCPPCCTLEI